MHLGDPTAERSVVLHLAQHVGKKEHLTVTGSGEKVKFGVASVFDDESRVTDVFLGAAAGHSLKVAVPVFPVANSIPGSYARDCLSFVQQCQFQLMMGNSFDVFARNLYQPIVN